MPLQNGDFHQPYALLDKHGFQEKLPKVLELIKQGTTPRDACAIIFGMRWDRWYKWLKDYEEDVEAGFTRHDSNLILLIEEVMKADLSVKSKLENHAVDRALNDDSPDMLKFVLERRYDYVKKQKSDVELGTKEDTTFNINITESEPSEN